MVARHLGPELTGIVTVRPTLRDVPDRSRVAFLAAATGTNGTFTDECDANGMLKEYYCDDKTICGPGMTDCAPYPTGEVISRTTARF